MKKITLKNLNLKEVEKLSREQLKNVLGGYTGGSDAATTTVGCPNVTCSATQGKGEGDYCANNNKTGECTYTNGIWGCEAVKAC